MTTFTFEVDPDYIDDRASAVVQTALDPYALTEDVPEFKITVSNPPSDADNRYGFFREYNNLTKTDLTPYQNIVETWGYNYDLQNPDDVSFGYTLESNYALNNVGPWVCEAHIQGVNEEGVLQRPFTLIWPRSSADKASSVSEFAVNRFILSDYDRTPHFDFDLNTNVLAFFAGTTARFDISGAPVISMRNGSDTAYVPLPYYDTANRLLVSGGLRVQGGYTSADGQDSPFYFQALGTHPNDSSIFEIIGPTSSGNILKSFSCTSAVTQDLKILNYNSANTAAGNKSVIEAAVLHGNGKALVRAVSYLKNGFDFGYDGSSDKFFICSQQASTNPINFYFDITHASGVRENSLATFYGSLKANGNFRCSPASSVSLAVNGELSFEATSNTSITVKYRGSDGVTRTNVLTMS